MGWFAYGTTGGSITNGVTVTFGGPPLCACSHCGQTSYCPYNDQHGKPWCQPCAQKQLDAQQAAEEAQRRHIIAARAAQWVSAAFEACAPMNRRKLYKALSLAFHPDAGGDAEIMTIINDVKDRYRL